MLVVDDILLSPFKGIMWVFRKIDQSAREELESRGERLKKQLSDLYMQLDTGRISEQEFDAREKQILDQLDSLKKAKTEQAVGQTAETHAPQASGSPTPASAPEHAAPPEPAPRAAASSAPAHAAVPEHEAPSAPAPETAAPSAPAPPALAPAPAAQEKAPPALASEAAPAQDVSTELTRVTTEPGSQAPAPLYKRWWFWGAAGAVVAGVIGATAALLRGGRKHPVTGPRPPEAVG